MGDVINLNDWKKEHGIPLPRSPYYALKATSAQIQDALIDAHRRLENHSDCYAAVVGYENAKTGDVKLLKEMRLYSDQDTFERTAGLRGHYCLGLVREQ